MNFCANLGKSAMETLAMIRKVFGEESMSRTWAFEWHAQFRADRKSETGEEMSRACSSFSLIQGDCSQRIRLGRPNSQFGILL
jgi:hypothetical protein